MSSVKNHWEKVYNTKAPDQVSWYRPHLETSLELVERAAVDSSASIIDVGGGESTLVDDLLAREYRNITVLDVSQTAIDATRERLGRAAERVRWLVADVTKADRSLRLTICGTTVQSFIFLPRRTTVRPTSDRWSGQ